MAYLHIKNVEVKLISNTFCQFSSDNLMERLSKFIPALFIKMSIPPKSAWQVFIKSSILESVVILYFFYIIDINSFIIYPIYSSIIPISIIYQP